MEEEEEKNNNRSVYYILDGTKDKEKWSELWMGPLMQQPFLLW